MEHHIYFAAFYKAQFDKTLAESPVAQYLHHLGSLTCGKFVKTHNLIFFAKVRILPHFSK